MRKKINIENKQDIGLALIGVGTALGVWSSLNTSSPTEFTQNAVWDPEKSYKSMNISLLVLLGMGAGIGLYYRDRGYLAAITTAGTGVAMWLWYNTLLRESNSTNL